MPLYVESEFVKLSRVLCQPERHLWDGALPVCSVRGWGWWECHLLMDSGGHDGMRAAPYPWIASDEPTELATGSVQKHEFVDWVWRNETRRRGKTRKKEENQNTRGAAKEAWNRMLLGTINNRATRLLSPCAIADSDDSLRTCSHAIPLVWTARSSELELHNNTFAWGC